MFDNYDFGKGVTKKYIDFEIDAAAPLNTQLDSLKSDMIQICYDKNYTLDIGWYPEFEEKVFLEQLL